MEKTEMKINWKVLIASILAIAVIYGAASAVLPRSYSGANLSFGTGSGTITMTNPSEESVLVQLIGSRYSSFSVSSPTEGVSGSSQKIGSGSSFTHVFEFELPPGISKFTVVRGSDVNFVADTATRLKATVQPLAQNETRMTLILAAVVVLGALFYISRATGHRWISRLRRVAAPLQGAQPVPVTANPTGGQGRTIRSYGDNRAEKPDPLS
jgi:hypothetical protein